MNTENIKHHKIKIRSEYFKAVVQENKRFEVRKNDRDYKLGDTVSMFEINEQGDQTGSYCTLVISYILTDLDGIDTGYCVFGWREWNFKKIIISKNFKIK